MKDLNKFPGVGALKVNMDHEKEDAEPDLNNHSPSLSGSGHSYVFDKDLERTVRWKRDLVLLPLICVMYTILFLDRTNIANARIEGLEKDLDMPSNGYNNCLWIFYIPFILAEIPSNLVLAFRKIKPRWFLGVQMFLLGKDALRGLHKH